MSAPQSTTLNHECWSGGLTSAVLRRFSLVVYYLHTSSAQSCCLLLVYYHVHTLMQDEATSALDSQSESLVLYVTCCYVLLCHNFDYFVMLCYAVLCRAMLCYAVPFSESFVCLVVVSSFLFSRDVALPTLFWLISGSSCPGCLDCPGRLHRGLGGT